MNILIDDDELIRMSWELMASRKGDILKAYSSIEDFLKEKEIYNSEVKIYVDSSLGNGVKGEEESKKIFDAGFKNIYLASGYVFETLPEWIIGQVGKEYPL